MKWTLISVLVLLLTVLIISGTSKRYGGGKNQLEKWYWNLVDKDATLEQLEKDISTNSKTLHELRSRFHQYHVVSEAYYEAAQMQSGQITDSVLASAMRSLVRESRNRYDARISSLQAVLKLLEQKHITQQDYQLAVMIAKTLPEAEKFQRENLPAQTEYNNLSASIDEAISRMKQMVR